MAPCRTSATNPDQYRKARYGGRQHGAHRVAFFKANGYWPTVARHTCDVKSCIEPTHIVDGTPADNVRDSIERGIHVMPPSRKLNDGMPPRSDAAAYKRERRRRIKEGTWVPETRREEP